jgi:hypothetical protein
MKALSVAFTPDERDGPRLRLCEVGAESPTCLYKAGK